MRRAAFHLLSAASMLLCIVVIALWIRSHLRYDMLSYSGGDAQRTLTSLDGRIQYHERRGFPHGEAWWYFDSRAVQTSWMIDSLPNRPWHERLGFVFHHWRLTAATTQAAVPKDLIVMVPYWFLVLLTAPLPLLWMIRLVRARRARPGHCPRCGYDLRASLNRCPECGLSRDGSGKQTGLF